MNYISELDGGNYDISEIGGKAFNLNRLISMGIQVPRGFVLKTDAYKDYTSHPKILDTLNRFIRQRDSLTLRELKDTSEKIRDAFYSLPMSNDIINQIDVAYSELLKTDSKIVVSVRSSAISEDLDEASFAGIHKTFLNVHGLQDLLSSISGCWASLWNLEAITYRERCGFDHSNVSMAVVVQQMVQAETSGVLFTSNPINNKQHEMVINSVKGLGESLVSGKATPDIFVVDKNTGTVLKRNYSFRESTTTNSVVESKLITLADSQINDLTTLGLKIEKGFGKPQDIEWACIENEVYILQSRPVITLLSRHDIWNQRSPAQISIEQPIIEKKLRNKKLGIRKDENLRYSKAKTLRSDWDNHILPALIGEINAFKNLDFGLMSLSDLALIFPKIIAANRDHLRLRMEVSGIIDSSIDRLKSYLVEIDFLTAEKYPMLLVGFKNTDTESKLALNKIAENTSQKILEILQKGPDGLKILEKTEDGKDWLALFDSYLERFGHLSSAKWDIMAPTYIEKPEFIIKTIIHQATNRSKEDILSRLTDERKSLVRKVLYSLPNEKRRNLLTALKIAQRNYPLKDDRDFYYLMSLFQVRRVFLRAGQLLHERGIIDSVNDVFFLKVDEIDPLLRGSDKDLRKKVKKRRLKFNERAQTSNEKAVESTQYEQLHIEDGSTILNGLGISPGKSTGRARIIRSLHDFPEIELGDILVAPALTPAWAPVMGIVNGVITDLGGILSHGGILAREFRIPAVVNTVIGTSIIKEGQKITIDGDKGLVYIHQTPLEEDSY